MICSCSISPAASSLEVAETFTLGLPGCEAQEETSKQAIKMAKDLLKIFFDSIMGIEIIRFYVMILRSI